MTWLKRKFPTQGGFHQCPACDHFSMKHRLGWLICPVCFWEDDATADDCHVVDVDELDVISGNNKGLTLREARSNFKQLGAVEERLIHACCSAEKRAKFIYEPREF